MCVYISYCVGDSSGLGTDILDEVLIVLMFQLIDL